MRLAPSPAAQFQATKTRAVLGAQLLFQTLTTILGAWLLLTTWVVWHEVGIYLPRLGHPYFGRWILCSLFNATLFTRWIWIPFDGTHLAIPDASAWLNGPDMYRHSFFETFTHVTGSGWGIAVDLVPLSLLGLLAIWRWRQNPGGGDHIRGLRLVSPREHNRELNPYRSRLLAALNRPSCGSGISLGGSVLPAGIEFEHFAFFGTSGSGKTTGIRQVHQQIRDLPAIVVDVEGEATMEFYDESRDDVILNPLDARMPWWSPWSELREEWFAVDAAAMAASIIRGKPRDDNQRFFLDSTRTVVEAILHVVTERDDAGALLKLVSLPRAELHDALKGTPAYALIDPEAHEQGAGIASTAVNAIKTFVHLPQRGRTERTWSAREWVQHRRGWIFLPSREDLGETIRVLQGVWLDCLVRCLMSEELDSEPTWISCDELPAMGYQPLIEQLVTRGRKRKIAALLGFQNVAQLRNIYGHDGAVTLTSNPTTKIVLRADEPETAHWCSDLIGEHEVERLQMTQLAGRSSYREGINLSPHRQIEHLVLPSEIQLLPPFEGYLCIAGHNRTTIRIPEVHLTRRVPAFIPRSGTITPLANAMPARPTQESQQPADQELLAQMKARALPTAAQG